MAVFSGGPVHRSEPLGLLVATVVEIKIFRRLRAESSRRPPRHRRDACSMAWRCRFLAARPSQAAASSPRNDLVKNRRVHPTHWLISTQVATRSDGARDVLDDDALRAKVGDVVPWRPGCDGDDAKRAFVGAVPLVARCARFFREAGWALEALVWSGCAVWSTDQLLAEVSRGSWALSPSKWSDASAAADSRGLWGDVVAREAALLPPESADED